MHVYPPPKMSLFNSPPGSFCTLPVFVKTTEQYNNDHKMTEQTHVPRIFHCQAASAHCRCLVISEFFNAFNDNNAVSPSLQHLLSLLLQVTSFGLLKSFQHELCLHCQVFVSVMLWCWSCWQALGSWRIRLLFCDMLASTLTSWTGKIVMVSEKLPLVWF